MKLTNKQLIDRYLNDLPARQVLALLTVIKTLLIRHEINLLHRVESAQGETADVLALVRLLTENGKLNRTDLSALIRLVETRAGSEGKQYTFASSNTALQSKVREIVHADLDVQESAGVGIVLQGDSRMYKRTLKTDVEKLLR